MDPRGDRYKVERVRNSPLKLRPFISKTHFSPLRDDKKININWMARYTLMTCWTRAGITLALQSIGLAIRKLPEFFIFGPAIRLASMFSQPQHFRNLTPPYSAPVTPVTFSRAPDSGIEMQIIFERDRERHVFWNNKIPGPFSFLTFFQPRSIRIYPCWRGFLKEAFDIFSGVAKRWLSRGPR